MAKWNPHKIFPQGHSPSPRAVGTARWAMQTQSRFGGNQDKTKKREVQRTRLGRGGLGWQALGAVPRCPKLETKLPPQLLMPEYQTNEKSFPMVPLLSVMGSGLCPPPRGREAVEFPHLIPRTGGWVGWGGIGGGGCEGVDMEGGGMWGGGRREGVNAAEQGFYFVTPLLENNPCNTARSLRLPPAA